MTLTKENSITEGPIFSSMLRFAIPMMIASVVQLIFHAVDIIVLGQMADTVSVASVGMTSAVTNLLIGAFSGFASGLNILLSRFVGAQDTRRTRLAVDTAIIAAFVAGLVLTVVFFFLAPAVLSLVHCPPECRDGAALYLRIYLLSTPAILVYNFGSTVIRVSGDTKRPLYYIIASGLLNVVLNYVLCLLLTNKVAAVAIATLASQVLSALLVMLHLVRMKGDCRVDLRHMRFSYSMFRRILYYGLPASLTNTFYFIPNFIIQSSVNSFGAAAITGNTAASNLDGIFRCVYQCFGSTTGIFIGQNLGAGRNDRVRAVFRTGLLFCLLSSLMLGILGATLGASLLKIYIPSDDTALAYGMLRMRGVTLFSFIDAINNVLSNFHSATGYPLGNTIAMAVSDVGLRIVWMLFLLPLRPSMEMLYFCYPVSRLVLFIVLALLLIRIWKKFRTGQLRKI